MKRHPLKPNSTYNRWVILDIDDRDHFKDFVILPLDAPAPLAGENEEVALLDEVRTDAAGEIIDDGLTLRRD